LGLFIRRLCRTRPAQPIQASHDKSRRDHSAPRSPTLPDILEPPRSERKFRPDRAPHVKVGSDQARHDNHTRGINDLGTVRSELRRHTRNNTVTHKHVCSRQCAERRIDRNNGAALDEIVAARDLAFLGTHQLAQDLLRLSLIARSVVLPPKRKLYPLLMTRHAGSVGFTP